MKMDIHEILKHLPHRYPIILVDPDPFPAWMTEADLDYYTAI